MACVAVGLQPVTLLVVPAVIAADVLGSTPRVAWRILARDAGIAVVTLTLIVYSVPFGLGWLANLSTAARDHVPFAPSSVISDLIRPVVPSASFDDLAAGGRIAAGAAGASVIGYLFITIRLRPLERTVGFALLAAAILAPVVYPTFLLWGLLCVAPTAAGVRRDWVIALSCVACVLAPVGLGTRGGQYATIGALALIALVLVPRLWKRHHRTLVAGGRLSAGGSRSAPPGPGRW